MPGYTPKLWTAGLSNTPDEEAFACTLVLGSGALASFKGKNLTITRVTNGQYKIVEGLEIDAFSQERINLTLAELQGEQDGVKHLL